MMSFRNNKGAITLYILICVLFFAIAIVNVHTNLKNKEARVESEYKKIKASYEKDAVEEYEIVTSQLIRDWKKSGEKSKKKMSLKDDEGKRMVLPLGFKIAEDSATNIKEGIVVVAPDNSEFVWVPVEDINSMVMCKGSTGVNDCNITKSGDELVCTTHIGEDICGRLYAETTKENFIINLNTQKHNATTNGLREPSVLMDEKEGDYTIGNIGRGVELIKNIVGISGSDDTDVLDKWKRQLQDEYEEMALRVYENNGFYIGRYETSLKTLEDGTKVAQSIANVESATAGTTINEQALTWYGLYKLEKDYSKKEYEIGKTLESIVGSTMIWGSQYDRMLLWMYDKGNGIDVTSTVLTSDTDNNGMFRNEGLITGSEVDDKLNNIYDLLGCKYEWTLEANNTSFRLRRGGVYNEDPHSPSYRYGNKPYYPMVTLSSRITLYVK